MTTKKRVPKRKLKLTLQYERRRAELLKRFLKNQCSNLPCRITKSKHYKTGNRFHFLFQEPLQLYFFSFMWGQELLTNYKLTQSIKT